MNCRDHGHRGAGVCPECFGAFIAGGDPAAWRRLARSLRRLTGPPEDVATVRLALHALLTDPMSPLLGAKFAAVADTF